MNIEDKRRELLAQIERIETYSRNDLISYQQIIGNLGNCSAGMISHAVAVLDWLSYLLSSKNKVVKRIEEVLQKYSNETSKVEWRVLSRNPNLIYVVIRCGVVHQFYSKATVIMRFPDSDYIACNLNGHTNINPDALYKMILDLLAKAQGWIRTGTDSVIDKMYNRLIQRQITDMAELAQAITSITLPNCPINQGMVQDPSTAAPPPNTEPTRSMV